MSSPVLPPIPPKNCQSADYPAICKNHNAHEKPIERPMCINWTTSQVNIKMNDNHIPSAQRPENTITEVRNVIPRQKNAMGSFLF